MGTADEQRGGGWGSQGVSEEGGSAGEKTLWWDDGQMKKAGGRGGVGGRGRRMEGEDSSPFLCRCRSRALSCASATLRLFSVCLTRSIIIILIIIMTTTMLKKYI